VTVGAAVAGVAAGAQPAIRVILPSQSQRRNPVSINAGMPDNAKRATQNP